MNDDQYNSVRQAVEAWAIRRQGEDWWYTRGEDAFQESIVKFLNSGRPWPEQNPNSYFIAATFRNFLNEIRHDSVYLTDQTDTLQDIPQDTEKDNLQGDLKVDLGSQQQEALYLHVVRGLSYKQVADYFNVPVTTITNWLHRVKAQLGELHGDPDSV